MTLIIGGGSVFLRDLKMKKNRKSMDLNRETAMRLWTKTFGKSTIAFDFAGREIVKGAYNDRNSDFGWNVDHILPQSKGGVTADYNLTCCHIKTNDEKANKFPCFKANGINFEIIKVQNHYEIKDAKEIQKASVNFYDSADGIKLFKKLKGIQNKPKFVGSILIRLNDLNDTAIIDFIERFFDEENVTYKMESYYIETYTDIIATNYNTPLKEDIAKLLDKCILLNTYLSNYFLPKKYISNYVIVFQVNYYKEKQNMYLDAQKINFDRFDANLCNSLYINDLVIENTEAKDRVRSNYNGQYTEYNYVFSNLGKNLEKEVNRK